MNDKPDMLVYAYSSDLLKATEKLAAADVGGKYVCSNPEMKIMEAVDNALSKLRAAEINEASIQEGEKE